MKAMIAVLNRMGENSVPALINVLEAEAATRDAYFGLFTPSKQVAEKVAEKLRRQSINSPIASGYAASTTPTQGALQIVKLEKSTLIFEGTIYSPTIKPPIAETIQPQFDYTKTVQDLLKETEGDFALIVTGEDKILAARDPIGVQPLYYGQNNDQIAIASNRRALWKLGIEETHSFPPGQLAVVTREGFKFELIKALAYTTPEPISMGEAAQTLQRLLERSVQIRVLGLKEVGVAFSGGLDSSIIACLAKKYCPKVQLIQVSLENQPETEEAWDAAEALDLPLQVHLFKEKDVEETVPKVLELIEEPEPLKVSVGVPFYWVAEKVAEAKLRVLLAGQGADELFGGYLRYVNEYLRDGDEKVRQTMFSDVAGIYESNLERDVKVCGFYDVQLRLPFASYDVVKFAMGLPTELKFEKKADSLRKLVLRKVAGNLDLPKSIAQKPKKAVQYSTGISDVLKKLAKRQKTTLGEYLAELFLKQRNPS